MTVGAAARTARGTPLVRRPVIDARDVRISYGSHEALRGVDLSVVEGEIVAILGPNGAGKSSLIEILEGFRRRDAGSVSVLGEDPARAGTDWRARVGVVLQSSEPERHLTVEQCLRLYAGYYPKPRPVPEMLEALGLTARAGVRGGQLSGGERRRLDVALALIGDPQLLFLDEPTTGFDPSARRAAWETIAALRDLGTTVVLTTHHMEEAERLADRIFVLVAGRIVAGGPPDTLGGRDAAPAEISFELASAAASVELPFERGRVLERDSGRVRIESTSPLDDVELLARWARERDVRVEDLSVRRPTLEDLYLELTEGAR